jgi:alanine-glyoxylate transaminase/serine-glyoxylate transaminase/serine-pyruvate transaminase
MSQPTIDHRGAEFAAMTKEIFEGLKRVFKTSNPVVVYPSSGTGAWEAALVNTLSPGDRVLMYETGQFATSWKNLAARLGLEVTFLSGDWRHGADASQIGQALAADAGHTIKAVAVVHNETSTGVTSHVARVSKAIAEAKHPALLMVDTISSLALTDYRHDEWGVDVSVGCSQKGLMLPPGIGLNAISAKALAASAVSGFARGYWDWQPILDDNEAGFFPYTPPTHLFYGLHEALRLLLDEEGLDAVIARHARHAEATRRAVRAWGLELVCLNPDEYANSLTAVLMPDGHDADRFRALVLDRFDMALGTGFGKFMGKLFRIGHLGSFNDLMLAGTLGGVEMGLAVAGVPFRTGGVIAALDFLKTQPSTNLKI